LGIVTPGNQTPAKAGGDFLSGGGEMGERMRALDWSERPLGPLQDWPQSLRSALSICLGSGFQIALYWGEELCLLYNDAWSPILGTKHPEALGQPAHEVWPEIWDTIGPMFARVFATGEATRSKDELLAMHRHGFTEECYFDYTFSPIRNEAGQVGGIFNAVVETTFRVIGERRTRLLRDLGESIGDAQDTRGAAAAAAKVLGTAQMDLPFSLIYLAEAGSAELSLSLEGAAGNAQTAAWAPPRLDLSTSCAWPVDRALQSGSILEVSNLSERFGSRIFGPWPESCESAAIVPLCIAGSTAVAGILIAGLSPRLSFDAEYQAFVGRTGTVLSTALSRSRDREHERRRAEALAEIDRAKTAFFSNVSHEFRTPLTLLLGPLEEALQKPTAVLSGAGLESAHRNALRLLKLVNTLLDFSRIEAGRAQARFVATDLAAATEDLASVFRSAIERAGLRLSVICPPLPQPVFVDPDMWEKIVSNLLSNAFKYTFEGEIRVELRGLGDSAELTVADTGTGIRPEALPQLFDRFYRVPGAHGRTHEGSGIGLSLARELVKLHGGRIEVESRLGAGSTFRVRIPTGSAHLPQEQIGGETSRLQPSGTAHAFLEEAQRWSPDAETGNQTGSFAGSARAETPPPQASGASAMILLVDDSRDMREYVVRLLESRYRVITAEDGQHALDLIDTGIRPDLVLSDVMMPRLDGFGLLKALRARPLTESTPVVFLSARAGEEARIEGFDVGADDYLIKPFNARELITRIHTHMRLSRQRRELDQRKDVFLATLAHELRNPLAPIRNAAQLLGSPSLEPKQLQWAQSVIQRQVKHMAWLLDDLLDIARITQGKLELKKQRITLSNVVDSAVEAARPLLDGKNHQFTVTLPSEPVTLDVDALRLSQVISNLLTNAAKYTDAGGHITLAGDIEGGMLSLSIKDNGIGIASESLTGIFVMFSQVAGAAARSEGGLGIGLALVRGLVALHGGTLEARSEGLGRGSEFIIRLPLTSSDSLVPPYAGAPVRESSGRRILVADDNKDAADSLALLLEMAGHEVRVVHDGRAALSLAQTFRPDAALLDIGMPQFNGYEVARALRQEAWGTGIHLIALTGWGQESDRQRAIDAGFDRHVTKPVDPDALQALLSEGAAPMPP
jgi:signal transduction histidine kinase